jgi:phosphoheptose isomerase
MPLQPRPLDERGRPHLSALLGDHIDALTAGLRDVHERSDVLVAVGAELIRTLGSGGRVLIAGNGGSAAQSQHFATELVGRFKRERAAYAVIALCADSSVLTAIANDYGYDQIFSRQVQALGRPGDILVALSTSGESENIVQAARAAREQGLVVIAVTGQSPCRLQRLADIAVGVASTDTPLVQELHMVLLHLLCDVVEAELAADECGRMAQ